MSSRLPCVRRLEEFVALAYAISLPISLTLSWVIFIIGLVLWLLNFLFGPGTKDSTSGAVSTGSAGSSPASKPGSAGGSPASKIKLHSDSSRVPPLTIPLLLFALAVTISGALNAGDVPGQLSSTSLKDAWASLYSLKNILPYFWSAHIFMRNRQLAKSAIVLLLWVSAAGGIYGAFQQVFDFHPGTEKYLQGTGFLGRPMAFAGQMQIFSMFALGLLLSGGFKNLAQLPAVRQLTPLLKLTQRTPVFVALLIANFIGLFFAGERSGWLGGFAGVLAAAAIRSWQLVVPALFAMCAGVGAAWFTIPLLQIRINSLLSGQDVSIKARKKIWDTCLQTYLPQSPLVGVGWLKFPHFKIDEATQLDKKDLSHGHSNYIHILTTTGVLGLASYVLLLLWTAAAALKKLSAAKLQRDNFEIGIAIGVFATNVALACSGIFEFNFGTAQVRLAQWFMLGLL